MPALARRCLFTNDSAMQGEPSPRAELTGDASFSLHTAIKGSKVSSTMICCDVSPLPRANYTTVCVAAQVYPLEVSPQAAHGALGWVQAVNAARP